MFLKNIFKKKLMKVKITNNSSPDGCFFSRPQSVNFLVCVSFAIKIEAGGRAEAKKFGFFEKNICILAAGYLTSSAK